MEKKRVDVVELLNSAPKRTLSDLEKQFIYIIIEKSKVQRESALSIVNKGFFTFFVVIGVVYWGRENSLTNPIYLDFLFVFGVLVLVFSLVSYFTIVKREEHLLDDILDNYLR